MSIFSKIFDKEEPVTCDVKESETLTKAREIVKRGEDLAQKINEVERTIDLLRYALDEGKDNVLLQITRVEPSYTPTGSSSWPVEHKLWMDRATQETLLRNMLTYYLRQYDEWKEEYKKL